MLAVADRAPRSETILTAEWSSFLVIHEQGEGLLLSTTRKIALDKSLLYNIYM